jgi:hypothetical protein
MKKILAVICFGFLSMTSANSEILTLGVSGSLGMLSALGKETVTGNTGGDVIWGATAASARTAVTATPKTKDQKEDDLIIGYAAAFGEVHLANTGLRLGVSYVPYPLESETTTNDRHDNCSVNEQHLLVHESTTTTDNNICTVTKNKIQVDLEDLISLYVSYTHQIESPFVDAFFVKVGTMEADLITNEVLTSGSKYGNANLSGEFFGLGVEKNLETGLFVRLEGNVTQFDTINLTNVTNSSENVNTISISALDGATATLSIGKSF